MFNPRLTKLFFVNDYQGGGSCYNLHEREK